MQNVTVNTVNTGSGNKTSDPPPTKKKRLTVKFRYTMIDHGIVGKFFIFLLSITLYDVVGKFLFLKHFNHTTDLEWDRNVAKIKICQLYHDLLLYIVAHSNMTLKE